MTLSFSLPHPKDREMFPNNYMQLFIVYQDFSYILPHWIYYNLENLEEKLLLSSKVLSLADGRTGTKIHALLSLIPALFLLLHASVTFPHYYYKNSEPTVAEF